MTHFVLFSITALLFLSPDCFGAGVNPTSDDPLGCDAVAAGGETPFFQGIENSVFRTGSPNTPSPLHFWTETFETVIGAITHLPDGIIFADKLVHHAAEVSDDCMTVTLPAFLFIVYDNDGEKKTEFETFEDIVLKVSFDQATFKQVLKEAGFLLEAKDGDGGVST